MQPDQMAKITRVGCYSRNLKTKKGMVKGGPYWYGFWMEGGKEKRVYIGKVLPQALAIIPSTGIKPPGRINYSWPGRAQAA